MQPEAYVEMAAVEERHWWFRGRRRILAAVIRRLKLPEDARILEVGSGTGGNLAMLAEFGVVTAVEMDDTARAISAKKVSGADVRAGWLPDGLPVAGEKYELICLFDVLEHVGPDEAALRAVRGCLAPGGVVVITVPAFARLWGPHDVKLHHKRRYERAELRVKLLAAGFLVVKLSYANMFLFPVAVAVRVVDRVLRRGNAGGTGVLPGFVNEVFAAVFGSERYLLGWLNLPVGLSLLAVARSNGG
jgi:SAM-dependent methyltransferase